MTPEKQQIAIAKQMGYYIASDGTFGASPNAFLLCHPTVFLDFPWRDSELEAWMDAPDYLTDLNACHEFEKVLSNKKPLPSFEGDPCFTEQIRYSLKLEELNAHQPGCVHFNTINATAAQRCEAFLRTLGLWEETK